MTHPFHLAFPVHDLASARAFYGATLGCREGRSSERWVDFDLYGHQIVAHLCDEMQDRADLRPTPNGAAVITTNVVDAHDVPVPHFGVVLAVSEWRALAERLVGAGVEFVVEPHTRFVGQPGEQSTFFLLDPSGNALEFKAFADPGQLFAR